MSTLKLTVPYTPRPKRSVKSGRYGFYNPSRKLMDMSAAWVANELKKIVRGLKGPLLSGPLLAVTHYRFPYPKMYSPKRREAMHLVPHDKRPDGDNLEKFLMDLLTGSVFANDAQVVWLLRSKSWTKEKTGSTIFFFKELSKSPANFDEILAIFSEHIKLE